MIYEEVLKKFGIFFLIIVLSIAAFYGGKYAAPILEGEIQTLTTQEKGEAVEWLIKNQWKILGQLILIVIIAIPILIIIGKIGEAIGLWEKILNIIFDLYDSTSTPVLFGIGSAGTSFCIGYMTYLTSLGIFTCCLFCILLLLGGIGRVIE